MAEQARIVTVERVIHADAASIFELIAEPTNQPRWDGMDNLVEAKPGQRVREVGDVFTMLVHSGELRENHVVEFVEGARIAWLPAPPAEEPPGHLWRWELEPLATGGTLVRHTYDWSGLPQDSSRISRARDTTSDRLQASLDRLAAVAEGDIISE